MKYSEYLKEVAQEILLLKNLREIYLWSELFEHGKQFAWVIICVIMRVIVLLTFPVSIPLLAFASLKIAQRRDRLLEEARQGIIKRYGKEVNA